MAYGQNASNCDPLCQEINHLHFSDHFQEESGLRLHLVEIK